jgi:DNA-binding SARP family transcriptional activator
MNTPEEQSIALMQRGEYRAAFAVIAALAEPTAYDLHNAGICWWALGDLDEALNWIHRARRAGLEVAKIDIAALQHLAGRNDEAIKTLDSVDTALLRPSERVRALYTHAEILRLNQALSQSISRLHEAWYECEMIGDADRREPIATSLALALHAQGDEAADKWLKRAEKHAAPGRALFVRLQQAIIACYRGQHEAGSKLVNEVTPNDEGPFVRTLYHYLNGLLNIESNEEIALRALEAASEAAAEGELHEFQVLARLRSSALELKRGQPVAARAHLARIERLPMSRVNMSEWKMRRGNVASVEGQADLAKRLAIEATNELKGLEHHREYAWAQLSLARVEAQHGGDPSARLDELADTCQFIGLRLLTTELSVTPNLDELGQHCSEYAAKTLGLTCKPQKHVVRRYDLKLFGEAELRADGRAVRLRSSRMLDLIAYLHIHPEAKLEEVISAIFAQTKDRKSAQTHFAQLRHLVNKQLPGLHIEPNKRLKTYRLYNEIALESDFETAQSLLSKGDGSSLKQAIALRGGPLLANVEAEWASELRHNVDHSFSKVGFRAMARLYDEGHANDALELGERLLEIDPFDRMVAAYTIEIVREVHGDWAARQQLETYIARYREEALPPPENLLTMRSRFGAMN